MVSITKPTRVTVSPDGAAYEVNGRDGLLGVHFVDADGDHAVIHFEPAQAARFRDDVARELARLNGETPIAAMVLRTLRNTFALVATMDPREAAKVVAEVAADLLELLAPPHEPAPRLRVSRSPDGPFVVFALHAEEHSVPADFALSLGAALIRTALAAKEPSHD